MNMKERRKAGEDSYMREKKKVARKQMMMKSGIKDIGKSEESSSADEDVRYEQARQAEINKDPYAQARREQFIAEEKISC